jgi:hypothetical protein
MDFPEFPDASDACRQGFHRQCPDELSTTYDKSDAPDTFPASYMYTSEIKNYLSPLYPYFPFSLRACALDR